MWVGPPIILCPQRHSGLDGLCRQGLEGGRQSRLRRFKCSLHLLQYHTDAQSMLDHNGSIRIWWCTSVAKVCKKGIKWSGACKHHHIRIDNLYNEVPEGIEARGCRCDKARKAGRVSLIVPLGHCGPATQREAFRHLVCVIWRALACVVSHWRIQTWKSGRLPLVFDPSVPAAKPSASMDTLMCCQRLNGIIS